MLQFDVDFKLLLPRPGSQGSPEVMLCCAFLICGAVGEHTRVSPCKAMLMMAVVISSCFMGKQQRPILNCLQMLVCLGRAVCRVLGHKRMCAARHMMLMMLLQIFGIWF